MPDATLRHLGPAHPGPSHVRRRFFERGGAAVAGRDLFNQSCMVCHVKLQITSPAKYGPDLSKNALGGEDAVMHEVIKLPLHEFATQRMPCSRRRRRRNRTRNRTCSPDGAAHACACSPRNPAATRISAVRCRDAGSDRGPDGTSRAFMPAKGRPLACHLAHQRRDPGGWAMAAEGDEGQSGAASAFRFPAERLSA
jgi:hypothetical protein